MKNKQLSITDLIDQKKSNEKKNKMNINVPALGGQLEVEKLPLKVVLKMLEDVDQESITNQMDFSCELIYKSCRLFRDQELQEAYDVKKPQDIVMAVLNDDIQAVNDIAGEIMTFYGVAAGEELKN